MEEIWKDITDYEGYYQVSNFGRVRSLDRIGIQRHYSGCDAVHEYKSRMMTIQKWQGRAFVSLTKDRKETKFQVGRLVAMEFIDNPKGYKIVNHLDANPMNNHVSNLEWCDQSRNIQWAYDNGTKIPPHMRKVNQYDLDGNFIKTWDSMAEAGRACGAYCNIYKVCTGKRNHAGGYKWQYV